MNHTLSEGSASMPATPEPAPSVADESVSSEHDDHDEEDLSRHGTPGFEEDSRKFNSRVKGPWSKDEDDLLASLVAKHGAKKWSVIAEHVPGRIGKQCRERWLNHLDTSVKKSPWTEEEDNILLDTQRRIGNRWCEIARMLPGRPENAVKNRFNSLVNKGKLACEQRARSPHSISDVQSPSHKSLETPSTHGASRFFSEEDSAPQQVLVKILREVTVVEPKTTPIQTGKPREPALTIGRRFLVGLGYSEGLPSTGSFECLPLKKRFSMEADSAVKKPKMG